MSTEPAPVSGIKGLHHNAYRCSDSERTRQFYEDFLGLPLAAALELGVTKTGRACHALHTFYRLDDGSYLAGTVSAHLVERDDSGYARWLDKPPMGVRLAPGRIEVAAPPADCGAGIGIGAP